MLLVYTQRKNGPSWLNGSNISFSDEKNDTKFILCWTGCHNLHFRTEGYELFQHCERKNCYVTEDRDLIPVEEYAAVLFFIPTSWDHPKEEPPKRRKPHQRYVFVNPESAIRFTGSKAQYFYNNFYNWTMTYRFDSDIVRRHGQMQRQDTNYKMPTKDRVTSKKGSVAWIVSNCHSANRREQLAKNLAKHVNLHIYGRCGTMKCPDGQDCYDYVASNYRFYLAFENSHCRDYTTEKFFKVLERDMIPIVYGGGDYASVAPPHSFINVEDFESVETLASYIKILEQDVDSYLEYFEWKKRFIVVKRGLMAICKLCEMLNDPNAPQKTYEDIENWWFGMSKCKSGKKLPKIALEEL